MVYSAMSKEGGEATMERSRSSRRIRGEKSRVSLKVKQIEFVSKHQRLSKGENGKRAEGNIKVNKTYTSVFESGENECLDLKR